MVPLTDRPPPAVPYWTRQRAVERIRRVLDGAPAGPERQDARLALAWLDARLAELERAVRAEDATVETQTP